jgi:pyridoxamine 5'-phosphate oxidase
VAATPVTRAEPLRREDLDSDPLRQFHVWFAAAEASGVAQPERMTLATASADGAPSARMVLLKGADERGFWFFSNYESRKGRELAQNPRAAIVFYWYELGRQVRVEGDVERAPRAESAAYFGTRPRGSRIAAWISEQSRPVAERDDLERRYAEAEERFADGVPLPEHWGGYVLNPIGYEFWQHRENRLHDRFYYTRAREGWTIQRLQP